VKNPPGKCLYVALVLGAAILLGLLATDRAHADPPKKKAAAEPKPPADKADPTAKPDGKKEKTYTFGGLDIDGKLKTPQLLYFLNRMKSEFDTTTPDKRSFIPELKRSTDEM
jgi:hypothetical protein